MVSWLANDVAKCGPLVDALDFAFGGVCIEVVGTGLNAFWLAMGWLAFFNVVWIIAGVRLAKYFRVMDPDFYRVEADTGFSTTKGSEAFEMPDMDSVHRESVYY